MEKMFFFAKMLTFDLFTFLTNKKLIHSQKQIFGQKLNLWPNPIFGFRKKFFS